MALQKFNNILPSLCAKFTLRSKQLRDFDGYSWTCDFVYITRLTDQAVSAYLCQVDTFFPSPIADVYSYRVPYAFEYATPLFVKSPGNFLVPIYFLAFEHTN